MQGPPTPTEDEDASIPTEHMQNGPDLSAGSRKAAKRTFPWDLKADEIQLALPPQEGEVIPARKKQRLGEHFPTPTDEATAENVSHAPTVALPPPDTANAANPGDMPTDPVTPVASLPSAATSSAPRRNWKPEEDAKLTEAVKKHGKKWVAIAPVERMYSVVTVGSTIWILPMRRRVNGRQKKTQR
jgi:hypothetical protein